MHVRFIKISIRELLCFTIACNMADVHYRIMFQRKIHKYKNTQLDPLLASYYLNKLLCKLYETILHDRTEQLEDFSLTNDALFGPSLSEEYSRVFPSEKEHIRLLREKDFIYNCMKFTRKSKCHIL